MENLQISVIGFANTTTKNNRNLKKRSNFMGSFKEIKRKHNIQRDENNPNIKEMEEYDMHILKLKLTRERNMQMINIVLGIVGLVVLTLIVVKIS